MQILVVIDSIPLLNSVVGIVSEIRENWTIGYLDNTPVAGELISAMKPNVLILEFQLWMRSKLDVIKHVKEIVPFSKVVVVTGVPYTEYRNKSLALGADFFFNLDRELDDFCRVLKQLGREFTDRPDISQQRDSPIGVKPFLTGEIP